MPGVRSCAKRRLAAAPSWRRHGGRAGPASLRRHDPDQVHRVTAAPGRVRAGGISASSRGSPGKVGQWGVGGRVSSGGPTVRDSYKICGIRFRRGRHKIVWDDHAMAEDADTCELWANRVWTSIDLSRALTMPSGRRMRCRECHGAVRAHKVGRDGMRAHFEHLIGHPGCSIGHYFRDGTPQTRHPKALT
ncbi:hypothetical protein Maq22A_c27745 [Methylobacterium aquaticum]|uniref:Uncharacterized protein n=1 Tax=Methylobacterium aquaticum TaxID=270351 RepID=A0A1Y0ZGI3_9HYPH|nr:hypothetical protein Maq22A_c27745 [Methylobacterium aquaticum]